MKNFNPMLLLDGYKLGHRVQYPKGTTKVYSTFTPRTSRVEGVDSAILFGLQGFIGRWLIDYYNDNFFNANIDKIVTDYATFVERYLGAKDVDTSHIKALYNLGYLPIKITALPEGTRVPVRVPMFTIESTHPDFFWITNYLETLISNVIWQPMTSATLAFEYRKILFYFRVWKNIILFYQIFRFI
jgi:nicotinamide phosphoribosyltransferase